MEIVIPGDLQRAGNAVFFEAFTKGFELGMEKGYTVGVNDGLKSAAEICAKSDWRLEGGGEDG